jgi:ABC-2 type transporter.
LFFLSGALFQIDSLPEWMQIISKLNPLSYGVDALRHIILGSSWTVSMQLQPLSVDLAIISLFDVAMVVVGTWAFSRMK